MSETSSFTALGSADPYLLLVVAAHLTGQLDLVDQAWAASQKPGRAADDVPTHLRDAAIERIGAQLQSVRPAANLGAAELSRLVQFAVGEAVGQDYVDMLLEESGVVVRALDRATAVASTSTAAALPEVAIIGGGLSGIATAVYLKKADIPFTIYEKSDGLGGTWYDNRYPGCGVDTTSHFYAYSFAINPTWPRYFSKQAEMLAYIERVVHDYDLAPHFRFGCAVDRAVYDEEAHRWHCSIRDRDGEIFTVDAAVLVSAVGQLNVPSYPAIPGLDSFRGPVVHTARWPEGTEYKGRRVALFGTGASGVQAGPTMAADVDRLMVFQRSPQWLSHRPNYHLPVSQDELWRFANVPTLAHWHRLQIIWQFADRLYPALIKAPDGGPSAANNELRRQWASYIETKMASRPDLLPKVMPDYMPLTKRAPVDFGWFDMLLRDNVELITNRISCIDGNSIVTDDGVAREADLIVLATGFKATRMLHTIDIVGRGGTNLRDVWGEDDPRAYLGITVPGFPNFFVMYGPNTNVGHGGSLIFQGECQARYIVQAIRHLATSGVHAIDVKSEVYEAYNDEADAQLERMVWSTAGVDNWFKNSKGRVVTNSPWRVVDYWSRTRAFDPADYRPD